MDDAEIFDLEHLSPMMQTHFSHQLTASHYPGRQQKNVLMQKQPDFGSIDKTD